MCQETNRKMSIAKQGYMPVNIFQNGEKHPLWKKDRSLIELIETPEYNEFRLRILKRDNYTCQNCRIRGCKGTRPVLEIHHKKSKTEYPELAMDETNCITLCHECHKRTDSYLNRWTINRMKKLDPKINILKI